MFKKSREAFGRQKELDRCAVAEISRLQGKIIALKCSYAGSGSVEEMRQVAELVGQLMAWLQAACLPSSAKRWKVAALEPAIKTMIATHEFVPGDEVGMLVEAGLTKGLSDANRAAQELGAHLVHNE